MKIKLCYLFVFIYGLTFSQSETISKDSIPNVSESKLEINIDLASRYLWRGQSWGGNYFVVQPAINYSVTDKLLVGFWATSNFKNDYYYPDGENSTVGYQEIDFNINYQINSFLSLQLWDYYWPSVEKIDGVDNSFYNYGPDGVKTVDAMMVFDFSDYGIPINATLSTLIAGNDYRYDSNGENPKQNYTTYLEAGYTLEKIYKKITIDFLAGAVLNNQAEYYTSGDYDKVSLVNLSLKATREFKLSEKWTMPLSVNYIHNAATKNTEFFGKNFLVVGLTFNYH
jgi:hypothetical protein